MNNQTKIAFSDVAIGLVYALLFLVLKGFVFNTADLGEHLSLVYKALQPSLYVYDFYVSEAWNVFTIRYYYVQLMAFFGQWFSIAHLSWCFNILCLTSSAVAWIKLARYLSADKVTGYLAPFFILFIFYGWTIGGNAIQYNLLICSTFAKAIAPWSLYLALRNKWSWSAVLLGVSGLFQILVSLQLALVLGAYLLFSGRWKTCIAFGMLWLLFAAPMLLPVTLRQFVVEGESNNALFYKVLYEVRNPHHYLPSLFAWTSYLKAIFLWTIGIISLKFMAEESVFRKVVLWMIWIFVGLLMYTFLLEILDWKSIGKLQFFKTTIWLGAFSAAVISVLLEKWILRYVGMQWIPAMAALFCCIWIGRSHIIFDTPIVFDHRTDEQKELSGVHEWIEENTPDDALFATFASNESFICEAKRSQFVAWNPIIHEPAFMDEWFKRFGSLYHQPFQSQDFMGTLERADIFFNNQFQVQAPFTHALFKKSGGRKYYGQILLETEHFIVVSR